MAQFELCYNDGKFPFNRITLELYDYGVSDDCYVVGSVEVDAVFKRIAELESKLQAEVERNGRCVDRIVELEKTTC